MGQKNRKHWPKQVRTMSKISVWVSVSRTYTSSTETEPHNIKYLSPHSKTVCIMYKLFWESSWYYIGKPRVFSPVNSRKNVRKQREIDFFFSSYFGMFSECIHDFDSDFDFCVCVCLLGVWVLRKCGKAKGNSFFFLWSVWFLRNWKQSKADGTKSIEIQSVWKLYMYKYF